MSNLLVEPPIPFVDIHCHLLPGIDDGATSWDVSLEMARMAVAGGIGTVIVTPHQLGMFNENRGQMVRERTTELQRRIQQADIPLRVMPGADVRIEPELIDGLRSGAEVGGDHASTLTRDALVGRRRDEQDSARQRVGEHDVLCQIGTIVPSQHCRGWPICHSDHGIPPA